MRLKALIFNFINMSLMGMRNQSIFKMDQTKIIELTAISDYNISSNITFKIKEKGREGYFRPCRIHNKMTNYIEILVNEYFRVVYTEEDSENLKNLITSDLKNSNNYKLFLNLPSVYEQHSLEMRNMSFSQFNLLGLPSLCEVLWSNKIGFVKYCKGGLEDYKNNIYLNHRSFHNFNLNRQFATRALAEILGISEIIPKSEIVKIYFGKDRYEMTGTLMAEAGDANPCKISLKKRNGYTKSFVRQISNLEYLDAICYQLDHRLGNCNVVINHDKIEGLMAFDNDAPMTFFPFLYVPKTTYCRCSSVIVEFNRINRPYIDSILYQKLNSVKFCDIRKKLGSYLTYMQLFALYCRVVIVRNAIQNSIRLNLLQVVRDSEWNYIDENKYFDVEGGGYGMTYLKYFLKVDERARIIELLGEDKTGL